MKIESAFLKYGSPLNCSGFCHSWKTTITNTSFSIFPENSRSICARTYWSHFWTRCTCAKGRNKCRFTLGSALRVHKRREAEEVYTKLQAKYIEIRAPFVKTFCVRRKAWPSLLILHMQNHLEWKGDISRCLRKYITRSGLSSLMMRKMTLALTLKFTVMLWNDWTGGQLSMVGKQHFQLRGIGKGGAQCRLPCDFPVKSGSWICFIKVGICLLMYSGKLCCVPDFGDFCSWKCNFEVGKDVYRTP